MDWWSETLRWALAVTVPMLILGPVALEALERRRAAGHRGGAEARQRAVGRRSPLDVALPTGERPLPEADAPWHRERLPRVTFHTANGFSFWPSEDASNRSVRCCHVRRLFEVRSPDGDQHTCAVEVAVAARESANRLTGVELLAGHPIWDEMGRRALSYYLWRNHSFPPDNVLMLTALDDADAPWLRAVRLAPRVEAWG
jgi:hypothetical protein